MIRMLEFHCTGQPGFLPELAAHADIRRARKRPVEVSVRFASTAERIATREGEVPANPGDAIVTAATGEQWPVSPAAFKRRYRASGRAGCYSAVPIDVLALCIPTPFAAVLGDGATRLEGKPGEWLVDYGDGHLGIVGADIFNLTYQLLD